MQTKMTFRWLKSVAILLVLGWTHVAPAERPNILLLFVDDLGWADVGCYGSEFHKTPNIDALASAGVRFSNAYTGASICSPTRASLMTGQAPARLNMTDWIPGAKPPKNAKLKTPADVHALPAGHTTIAEALKAAGYQTYYTGKWHLNHGGNSSAPQHGFDIYENEFGGPEQWPKDKDQKAKRAMLRTSTRKLTDNLCQFLGERDPERPFFAILSYRDVHTPIQDIGERAAEYEARRTRLYGEAPSPPIAERNLKSRSRQDNPRYASMVTAVDASVGRIQDHLQELGLAKKTVVIFYSDNGGLCTRRSPGPTSNLPLRSGKGWLYEGGIRVPLVVAGPGVKTSKTGEGRVVDTPVTSMDLFPTALALAGQPLMPKQHVDGVNLLPLISGTGQIKRDLLAWHYPHYHASGWRPGSAIRVGNMKLIEFYAENSFELYDLASDPGERNNLAAAQPAVAKALREKLRRWLASCNAQLPETISP